MKKAVQFGAGNIGRGFMGQLFQEAGYKTVFVDVSDSLVGIMNERGRYILRLLDAYTKQERDITIDNFEAVSTRDFTKVVGILSETDIVGTAVGVKNLESIAPFIAEGAHARYKRGGGPLDIYLCENIQTAAEILKRAVIKFVPADLLNWVEENIGFVGTVVARMVPPASDRFGARDPLFVVADAYHKLPYDGKALRATPPDIDGIKPVRNFQAEVERKIFTYNLGHAALGYLGYLKGYRYVHEPFSDEFLYSLFEGALDEISEGLLKMYPMDLVREEQDEIRRDIDIRFGNPLLMDPVQRVARDPIRKLGSTDRLIGSARLCLAHNINPKNIAVVCAAALCYDDGRDLEAVKLQRHIGTEGVEKTLEDISGVNKNEMLGKMIVESYTDLQKKKKIWKG
jgi:mannitol-1-phosphate 5-dehydrogenase